MSVDLILDALKSILELLEQNKEKLDRILVWGRRGAGLTTKETQSLRKLEKDWENAPETTVTEKVIVKGGKTVNEKEEIIWTVHEGKKYKACRYKCGYYVSWDETAKKYLHYDAGFKLIGHECPKYAIPTEEELE